VGEKKECQYFRRINGTFGFCVELNHHLRIDDPDFISLCDLCDLQMQITLKAHVSENIFLRFRIGDIPLVEKELEPFFSELKEKVKDYSMNDSRTEFQIIFESGKIASFNKGETYMSIGTGIIEFPENFRVWSGIIRRFHDPRIDFHNSKILFLDIEFKAKFFAMHPKYKIEMAYMIPINRENTKSMEEPFNDANAVVETALQKAEENDDWVNAKQAGKELIKETKRKITETNAIVNVEDEIIAPAKPAKPAKKAKPKSLFDF